MLRPVIETEVHVSKLNDGDKVSRFVILEHEYRGIHWDFMLEWGSTLRTWALSQSPVIDDEILARALSDHRLKYLDYEGPVSNDRGKVKRWDQGTYQLIVEGENRVVVRLQGLKLLGEATLLLRKAPREWYFSLRSVT